MVTYMVLPPITKILYAHLSILFVQQESKIVPDVTGLVTSRVADPDSEKIPGSDPQEKPDPDPT